MVLQLSMLVLLKDIYTSNCSKLGLKECLLQFKNLRQKHKAYLLHCPGAH